MKLWKKRLQRIGAMICAAALCASLTPTAALAESSRPIYSSEENGIAITLDEDDLGVGSTTVSFDVIVDGETVADDVVFNDVHTTLTQLTINAEGYDVTFNTSGMSVAQGIKPKYDVGFDVTTDEHTCTINLASQKTSDLIQIGKETDYGDFGWSKPRAGNSAYDRTIEIYVNGEYQYSQVVNTPRQLSNGDASPQFWFVPNTDLYTQDCELDNAWTMSEVFNTLKVYLKTKCPCGLSTCMCPGGEECVEAGCTENCTCAACQGENLEENQILAVDADGEAIGVIEYNGPLTNLDKEYNLTVKVHVNGELAFVSEELKVGEGRIDALNFTPNAGYYFPTTNPYDIFCSSGVTPSWDKNTGWLELGWTEEHANYHNVINLYLYTYPGDVYLDVTRYDWVEDDIDYYTVSFTWDGRDYAYTVTDFATAQSICIPKHTDVTIRAVCNQPGMVVDEWVCHNAWDDTAVSFVGSKDSEHPDKAKNTAYGPEVTLRDDSSQLTSIVLLINSVTTEQPEKPETPARPDADTVIGLLEDSVTTICTNAEANHTDLVSDLIENSFVVGSVEGNAERGYTVEVRISDVDPYVSQYNSKVANGHEKDLTEPLDLSLLLAYNAEDAAWEVSQSNATATIYVVCDESTEPTIPNPGDSIASLTNAVNVACSTDSQHRTEVYGVLGESASDWTLQWTEGETTATLTISNTDLYVAEYNKTSPNHVYDDNNAGEDLTVGLAYNGSTWTVSDAAEIYVCDQPQLPDEIDIKDLGNVVTIDCVNEEANHSDIETTVFGTYGTDYTVAFQAGKTDAATITIVNTDQYVNVMNADTQETHTLADDSDLTIDLTYDAANGWTVAENDTATIKVQCETAEPEPEVIPDPTPADVSGLGSVVEIVCDVAGSGHTGKVFAQRVRGGAGKDYTIEHEELSNKATITIRNTGIYVNLYNEKVASGHALADDSDLTIGLVYGNGAWKLDETDSKATVKVYCIPDPTASIINDLGVEIDTVCVVDEDAHGVWTEGLRGGEGKDFVIEHEPLSDEAVVTITKTDLYVKAYNDHNTKTPHTYVEAGSDLSFRLRYVNGAWTLDESDPDATIRVTCALDVTVDTVAANVVRLLCDTNEAHKGIQTELLADTFTVDATDKDAGTAVVTLKNDADTMARYADVMDVRVGSHSYNAEADTNLSIELVFDAESLQWQCTSAADKATLHFTCEIPAPEHVHQSDLEALLDVTVNCGKEMGHGQGEYEVIAGSWNDGGTQTDADGSSYIMVRVRPDKYVEEYNSDASLTLGWPHAVVDEQKDGTLIRLNWNAIDGKWELADAADAKVAFTVVCEADGENKPVGPTDADLGALVDVVIDCVSNMGHADYRFADVLSGSWNMGEYARQEDGSITATLNIHSQPYVDAYNEQTDVTLGWTHTAQEPYNRIKLVWTPDGGWTLQNAEDSIVRVAAECHATTPGEENKPSIELIQEALSTLKVRLDCVANMGHADGGYDLMDGSYHYLLIENDKYGNYTLQVYVTADKYLAAYNADQALNLGYEHYLKVDTNAQVTEFTLTCGEGDVWSYSEATVNPVTFEITCDAEHPNVPAAPDYDELTDLIGKIVVDCVTDAAHADAQYDLMDDYNVVVKGTVEDCAVATVYIPYNKYVAKYNKASAGHVLAPEETYGVVHLDYDKNNGWYVKDESQLPVVFEVVCAPDLDDINNATGNAALTLDCVNGDQAAAGHNAMTMALQADTYTVSPVDGAAETGYTVTVTVQPHQNYLDAYNAQYKDYAHSYVANDANDAVITLVNKDGVWTAKDNDTAFFAVSCPAKTTVTPSNPPVDEHPDIAEGIANGTWGGKPTPTPAPAASGTAVIPQTADAADIGLWTLLAVLSLAGLTGLGLLRRKRGQ